MEMETSLGVMKMLVVKVAQHCEYTNDHRIVCFKIVDFMLCKF